MNDSNQLLNGLCRTHTHTQMQPPCTDQYALHTWITCPPGRICRCRQRLNDLSFFRFLCQWQRLWLCNSAEQAALSAPLLFSPSSVSWPRCFVLAVSDLVASDDGEAGERQTALLLIPPHSVSQWRRKPALWVAGRSGKQRNYSVFPLVTVSD